MTATMTWSNDKDGLALSLVTLNSLITNHLWHQDLWEPDRQDMTVETVKSEPALFFLKHPVEGDKQCHHPLIEQFSESSRG